MSEQASASDFVGHAWPAVLALVVWVYGWLTRADRCSSRSAGFSAGRCWRGRRCAARTARRRFLCVLAAFLLLHVVIPALRRLVAVAARSTASADRHGSRRRAGGRGVAGGWIDLARLWRRDRLRRRLPTTPASPANLGAGGIRHPADSRGGKIRAGDGENPLAGGEGPDAAAVVRAGGVDATSAIPTRALKLVQAAVGTTPRAAIGRAGRRRV